MIIGDKALEGTPVVLVRNKISNSYLISGEKIAVVDAGVPSDTARIIGAVKDKLHREPLDISLIVMSHYHFDHVGGIPELKNKTGAQLMVHRKAANYIYRGVPVPGFSASRMFLAAYPMWLSLGAPIPKPSDLKGMPMAGIPGLTTGLWPVGIDQYLQDEDDLPGFTGWKVYRTPGHTLDSICLFHEDSRTLITGDTILEIGGHLHLAPVIDLKNLTLAEKSLAMLQELNPRVICPAHGRPIADEQPLSKVRRNVSPLSFFGI